MSYRPDDTIVMPTKRTRADGVDPDEVTDKAVEAAKGVRYERAIFSYSGTPIASSSTIWVPRVDVRLTKAIVVVRAWYSACTVHFFVNAEEIADLALTGVIQQLIFEDPVDLTAETDTLWISFTKEAGVGVTDLSVFVSFEPPPEP